MSGGPPQLAERKNSRLPLMNIVHGYLTSSSVKPGLRSMRISRMPKRVVVRSHTAPSLPAIVVSTE